MKKLIVTLISLLLTACGGGSGDSQGQAQINSTTVSAASDKGQNGSVNAAQAQGNNDTELSSDTESQEGSAQQSEDVQPEQDSGSLEGMEAVVVDEAFDFRTDVPVTVSIAPGVVNNRAFINICPQEATLTNDDACFLRAPIDSNGLFVQIVLPHSEQKLKAEIWYYSTDVAPLVYSWEFDGAQQQQIWELN
ncbi:hypothetical protein C3B51_16920 [Pseudoalteromonas rubra]|uniref:Lipoprotein n=1 Tax=Pseudoalteromonas rubra TaxID=43658 RepID=A0A4Q7E344_9GAMM|nr:hypothetical protein [Pseudoalteromonas rubra]RZM77066.1 hypothetical protein C3B51_16920 [Pseudoalteromonas rubra]